MLHNQILKALPIKAESFETQKSNLILSTAVSVAGLVTVAGLEALVQYAETKNEESASEMKGLAE